MHTIIIASETHNDTVDFALNTSDFFHRINATNFLKNKANIFFKFLMNFFKLIYIGNWDIFFKFGYDLCERTTLTETSSDLNEQLHRLRDKNEG